MRSETKVINQKSKKIVFDNEGNPRKSSNKPTKKEPGRYFDQSKPFNKIPKDKPKGGKPDSQKKAKKIVFGDDGEAVEKPVDTSAASEARPLKRPREEGNNSYKQKRKPKALEGDEENQPWYMIYAQYNKNSELVELKESEMNALSTTCKSSFETELPHLTRKNPSDAKWLQTALHKGTAKDRVNSGALLVHSNPLANLEALGTLIGLCKVSARVGPEVLTVISELFMEALIPSDRKLLSLSLRGADWKAIRAREDISKEVKSKIYAWWHFETELKELYFEFLKNLQLCLHTGQDPVKSSAVVCASRLLCHGPEKEQLLLSMVVNKLGDPSNKIAAKALHHLSDVTFKHPNMCGVITNETEKLLFRNNISEQAQHFALCFLAQIAPRGQSDVCTKLVNICFAFFKVLVKKGAVNNKTMQAILRCLKKSIVDAKPVAGSTEIMTKEMQDTIYRLVHLAEIQISIQTLSLLLQLITVRGEKSDRFYNALYRKMTDLNITTVGIKVSSHFFHIVHRAVHEDRDVPRAMAFIKRILQMSMYMPPHMACGCLIIVNKILKSRPELRNVDAIPNLVESQPVPVGDVDLSRFDDDDDEKYEDVVSDSEAEKKKKNVDEPKVEASWHHVNVKGTKPEQNSEDKSVVQFNDYNQTGYDPYHRVAAYAGAQFVQRTELSLLQKHFHPTCKVFTESIVDGQAISYYGDPLRDFSLPHFLERFAFKNPKKVGNDQEASSSVKSAYAKKYTPQGGRAHPVQSLTKDNCTEEERFIFNYLEKKRERREVVKKKGDDEEKVDDVDDDEFEAYLDGLCKPEDMPSDVEDDIDFMKEMGGDWKTGDVEGGNKKKKSIKKQKPDDESDEEMDEWSDGDIADEDGDDDEMEIEGAGNEENDDDDEGSISLDEDGSLSDGEDDDFSLEDESASDADTEQEGEDDTGFDDDDDDEPKKKKLKNALKSGKQFTKTLKGSSDMSSLFAAADDFAELLEETSKDKKHGTSAAVFNQDKSSLKQLKWEEKRRQAAGGKRFNKKPGKFGMKHGKRK